MIKLNQQHPILWLYLFFGYFSIPYQILIYFSGMSGFTGLRQAILMSVIWLVPVLIWPNKAKILALVIGIILWVPAIIAFSYWLIYGQDFSQSVIFIIFETNIAEGTEFILSYIQFWHVAALIVFTLIPVYLWRAIPVLSLSTQVRYLFMAVFMLIVTWPVADDLVIQGSGYERTKSHLFKHLEPASPWNLAVGYARYREQLQDMALLLENNKQLAPLKSFSSIAEYNPDTLVLVIGESTNSQRMNLYGYDRDTTPRLNELGDELLRFNDVVSARPYTIESLQQALSFADSKNPDDFFTKPTLLNIIKQAGYHITWITNQQTQTKRNTMLTMLSQLADKQIYLNNNRAQNASQYDDVVINPFMEVLQQHSDGKQMIIVHLLGTHRQYRFRYPEVANYFTDNDHVPSWVDDSLLEVYNSYDNAVRYNDYVVATLIERLKETSKKSLFMYFSDHGEEVYDEPSSTFSGRDESKPTPAMYTVPFIVWSSPEFNKARQTNAWKTYLDRPFSLASFIHTLPDMIGLNFDGLERANSLVSDQFIAQPRWIGDPHSPKLLRDFDVINKSH